MYKVLCPEKIEEAGEIYLKNLGYEIVTLNNVEHGSVKAAIADCDAAVIRFNAKIDADILGAAKKLKVVARHGVGYNNIDTKAAEELGIFVTNARGSNANSVAEQAMTLILALAKKLPKYKNALENGAWATRNDIKTEEIEGRTLGVYGYGANGRILAKMAHFGFGMNVLAYDPYTPASAIPEYVTKVETADELFKGSDVISMHCLLTDETRHCINAEALKTMKPTAWLVNCARGELVDETALYEALTNGTIAAAGLDVFEEEPPKQGNPLFGLENFMGTLHQASNSKEASDRCALYAAYGVEEVLNRKTPRFAVNKPDPELHAKRFED